MKNECFRIVLDTSSKDLMGHYLQFSIDVCESLERNRRPAIIFSSNMSLLEWFHSKNLEYVKLNFTYSSERSDVISSMAAFLNSENQESAIRPHILILRGKDLDSEHHEVLKRLLAEKLDLHLEILVNVSGIISASNESKAEKKVVEYYSSMGSSVNFLAWDKRVENRTDMKNIRFLPEPKNVINRHIMHKKTIIGFYGKLSFERGLFDLLCSVFFNPKLHYQIIGYGYDRKNVYRSKSFVSMRRTPLIGLANKVTNYLVQVALLSKRVSFEERYFRDENEMSESMQTCSAVYFSCSRSPYSSGLIYQSFASEVPVIWEQGNSAMAYILDEVFPEGSVTRRSLFNLNELFRAVCRVEGLTVKPIFGYSQFDDVLTNCFIPRVAS
jgi:hypothetical protein